MEDITSPTLLAQRLIGIFPAFGEELADEQIENYHQALLLLTPVIAGYLEGSPERTVKDFCALVNLMAVARGDKANAIST